VRLISLEFFLRHFCVYSSACAFLETQLEFDSCR
jgi:hypothetical protein